MWKSQYMFVVDTMRTAVVMEETTKRKQRRVSMKQGKASVLLASLAILLLIVQRNLLCCWRSKRSSSKLSLLVRNSSSHGWVPSRSPTQTQEKVDASIVRIRVRISPSFVRSFGVSFSYGHISASQSVLWSEWSQNKTLIKNKVKHDHGAHESF